MHSRSRRRREQSWSQRDYPHHLGARVSFRKDEKRRPHTESFHASTLSPPYTDRIDKHHCLPDLIPRRRIRLAEDTNGAFTVSCGQPLIGVEVKLVQYFE